MVLKVKSDEPIPLIRDSKAFSKWQVPELNVGKAKNFHQPVEEEEKFQISKAEQDKIDAQALKKIADEAHEKGFEAGRQEGLLQAQVEIKQQLGKLDQIISQLTDPLSLCGRQTEQELLQLAFAIARQIVRREIQQDPTQLIAIIREALKLLPIGAQDISIALHPEDASAIKEALSLGEQESSVSWQLKSDPSIERGGCQVKTENSKIDASIDKQIAVLFSRIVGGQRAGEADVE